MNIPWRPAQTTEAEWMDAPGHPPEVIRDNLEDLRRANRLLGGTRLTLRPLARFASQITGGETLRVLDVATGAGDIPRAMAHWARRRHRPVFIVASDVNLDILRAGRDAGPVPREIVFVVADATALPFAAGAFHVSACSLALHHMLAEQAVLMLREMRRCATLGVIVNDVVRSWLSYGGAIVATRLGSRNHLTLHDGPLSVLRAFTVPEMRDMARQVGLTPGRVESFLFYRVSITATATKTAT